MSDADDRVDGSALSSKRSADDSDGGPALKKLKSNGGVSGQDAESDYHSDLGTLPLDGVANIYAQDKEYLELENSNLSGADASDYDTDAREKKRKRSEQGASDAEQFKKYLEELKPLLTPLNAEDVVKETPRDLIGYLTKMEAMWNMEVGNREDQFRIAKRNFGFSEFTTLTPGQVEQAQHRNVLHMIMMLQVRMSAKNVINNQEKKGKEYMDRIKRLYDIAKSAYELLYHSTRLDARMTTKETLTPGLGLTQWISPTEWDIKKPVGKLLHFYWQDIAMNGYRKKDGFLYAPEFNKAGQFTHSYRNTGKTIKQYLWQLNSDRFPAVSTILEEERGVAAGVFEKLSEWDNSRFPTYVPSRYLISFEDGIYNIFSDEFVKYEDVFRSNIIFEHEDTLGEPNPDMDDDESSKQARLYNMDAKFSSCRYMKMNFEDGIKYVRKVSLDENGCEKVEYESETSEADFMNIPTPALDTILERQNIRGEHRKWVLALLGRNFFWGGQLDNWQVAPFIIGIGGTGKSAITSWFGNVYPSNMIGWLSSNVEAQWALSSIAGRYMVLGLEIGERFKLDQTEFQSMIALEHVSVAKKHETAKGLLWNSHVLLCGNVFPNQWKNQGNNVGRRVVPILFNEPVPSSEMRADLGSDLKKESPAMILKMVRAYRHLAGLYGQKSFWQHCPQEFRNANDMIMEASNTLLQFLINIETYGYVEGEWKSLRNSQGEEVLDEKGEVIRTCDSWVEWAKMQTSYGRYRGDQGLKAADLLKSTSTDTQRTLRSRNFIIMRTEADWKKHGFDKPPGTGEYVLGLSKKPETFSFGPPAANKRSFEGDENSQEQRKRHKSNLP
jgi:hypothetical protein